MAASEMVTELQKKKPEKDIAQHLSEYKPKEHLIHDETHRPKKRIKTDAGVMFKDVARLALPLQKIIVRRAAAFLIGEGINHVSSPENDSEAELKETVQDIWRDAKMDFRTREIARILFSETEVAELWYFMERLEDGKKKTRLRMKVLSNSKGDKLYPHFDEYGDMDAFGRGYKIGNEEFVDVYTADVIYKLSRSATGWDITEQIPNSLKKIPVVYYSQDEPEWADVQDLIQRYEALISNFADSNDYFGSPMVKVKGEVKGFADKGESGKVITLGENADASYLTWDQAPEAIKLEKDTLQELIFSLTQTPDISFTQMKGLGTVSGIALRLMFIDALLKSQLHQETFSEGVQRSINIIKAGAAILEPKLTEAAKVLDITPEFTFYLPENDSELVDTLVRALGGGKAIMSRKTALKYNPFVEDAESEEADIKEDESGNFGTIFEGI